MVGDLYVVQETFYVWRDEVRVELLPDTLLLLVSTTALGTLLSDSANTYDTFLSPSHGVLVAPSWYRIRTTLQGGTFNYMTRQRDGDVDGPR